jgi:E3 ubiquitin-protein ligase TRIP12
LIGTPSSGPPTSKRRAKKVSSKKTEETTKQAPEEDPKPDTNMSEDDDAERPRDYDDDDDDDENDPFRSGFLGRPGGPGLSHMRAMSGLMSSSATAQQLRTILERLRCKDDPSVQVIALSELSELLLVSTEDNLSGHFSPDQFVKELVTLMQPNEFGEENMEMMILACRCIANLMEALPPATANVVYGGAVPVLCNKLLEVTYEEIAEQALSVSFPTTFRCLVHC